MGLFNKMKEPVFLKEDGDAQAQLEKLKELEPKLNADGKEKIRQDIKCLEYGIQGENAIAFELKNSHMPMFILHDIYLEDGDLSAQIDYMVFTKKLTFIIECKNLYGDIEINSNGDFIRTMTFNGRKKKEGIYSPVTQNRRHMDLVKKIKVDAQSNFIFKKAMAKIFDSTYRSIVVLANPKTILNSRYAPKEIKNQVIRVDQLIAYIKEQNKNSKETESDDSDLKAIAESLLRRHKPSEKDYTGKYQQYLLEETDSPAPAAVPPAPAPEEEPQKPQAPEKTENPDELFNRLKAYRLAKSREENIKPYFLYNDSQLRDLISKMPANKEELLTVNGFGKVKAEKYGDDILEILDQFRNHC